MVVRAWLCHFKRESSLGARDWRRGANPSRVRDAKRCVHEHEVQSEAESSEHEVQSGTGVRREPQAASVAYRP